MTRTEVFLKTTDLLHLVSLQSLKQNILISISNEDETSPTAKAAACFTTDGKQREVWKVKVKRGTF
jgi:hypothetical protein